MMEFVFCSFTEISFGEKAESFLYPSKEAE